MWRVRNAMAGRGAVMAAFAVVVMFATVDHLGARGVTAADRGRVTYREYCAVCHGNNGEGHGPVASASKIHPTDLTALRRINGVFPAAQIDAVLSGANPIVAHGAPGMTVWPAMLASDANGNEAVAAATRHDLIAFIESIQKK